MEDPVFKGNQKYSFEMDLDEAGKQLFGGQENAGVAFQIVGLLRYIRCLCQYNSVYTLYIDVLSVSEYIPDLTLFSICRVYTMYNQVYILMYIVYQSTYTYILVNTLTLKTEPTKPALPVMTLYTPWFSSESVPLKNSNCLSRGLWRTLE